MYIFGKNSAQVRISVLGCGWLGLPLALQLKEAGHTVRGSVTSEEKAGKLRAFGLSIHVIDLHEPEKDILHRFLSGTELLLMCVPPGKESTGTTFVEALAEFLDVAEQYQIPRIIYTSSIGVYENAEDRALVQETDVPVHPHGNQGHLLRLENLVLSRQFARPLILRLGGLIGEDRHPVYYLAGKTALPNPEAPVNLIHQRDCIDAILSVLNQPPAQKVYNLVYPDHPTRKSYYTKKARQLQLPEPHFLDEPSVGKVVSCEAFTRDTGFIFKAGI